MLFRSKAGCRQSEETVGHQVMSTHVTPSTLQAGPKSLKLSESACLKELVIAQGQALERKPSNAWARKIPALNRPKNAVTVSIIAKSFAPLQQHNATRPRTVKRIPGRDRKSGRSDALAQQFRGEGNRGLPGQTLNSGARAGSAGPFSPKSALPPPKLNAELMPARHCGIGRWGVP